MKYYHISQGVSELGSLHLLTIFTGQNNKWDSPIGEKEEIKTTKQTNIEWIIDIVSFHICVTNLHDLLSDE